MVGCHDVNEGGQNGSVSHGHGVYAVEDKARSCVNADHGRSCWEGNRCLALGVEGVTVQNC